MKKKQKKENIFKKFIYIFIVLIFFIFLLELIFLIFISIKKVKKPYLITTWQPYYKRLRSMSVYNDHLFICDEELRTVKVCNSLTGEEKFSFQFVNKPLWAAENSKKEIFVIVENENKIYKISDNKKEAINLDNITPLNLAIDKKDNIFLFDKNSKDIIKISGVFDKDFLLFFNTKFYNFPSCIIIGGDEKLYVRINQNNFIQLLVFDEYGKLVNNLKLMQIKKPYFLSNVVVDIKGNIYIENYENHLIYVFNKNGENIGIFEKDIDNKKIFKWPSLIGFSYNKIYLAVPEICIIEPINYD